jgi:hypothetical protein
MEGHNRLDKIDRNILRILSLYEDLNLLQLWYEVGESDGAGGSMTGEEILERLKSLSSQGFVECLIESVEGIRWALSSKGEVER